MMELIAVRGNDSLFSGDASRPDSVGFQVMPGAGVILRIVLAVALAGGYWKPPGDQPTQAEIRALFKSLPIRKHPSIETLRRANLPLES